MALDPLPFRSLSTFPLSVGTGLAFESLFQGTMERIDPERVIPQMIRLEDYSEFWINLSTLFRNMMSSLNKEDGAGVISSQLKDSLMSEIDVIQSLVTNEGGGKTKVIFYVCEYKKLESKYSSNQYVAVRQDNTTNQKIYRELHNQAVKLILTELGQSDTLRVYDSEIAKGVPMKSSALIITHSAYDLLGYRNFNKLDLLESHTGVLRKKPEWYLKYLNGSEIPMIPFMEGFFPVFGDKEHFRPMDFRLRKEIIELAVQNKWTQLTTVAKIRSNLDQLKNQYYKDVLKTVL